MRLFLKPGKYFISRMGVWGLSGRSEISFTSLMWMRHPIFQQTMWKCLALTQYRWWQNVL